MSRIEQALQLAFTAHEGQIRKVSKLPFIIHPLEVMQFLIDEQASEDVIIAGILHDTLEDTTITPEDIKEEFGENVLRLVHFCTEKENLAQDDDEEKRASWQRRKQRIITACKGGTHDELLIELADKLSNLESMEKDLEQQNIWPFFHASKEDIQWYYETLGNLFEEQLSDTKMWPRYKRSLHNVFK